jgi:site-specific recombinase XerD
MTALRKQFIEYLQAQEMSPRTQQVYVRAVRQLAEYYHRSPDRIADEQIRPYLVYLKEEKHLSDETLMQLLCGIKLFYAQILNRPWTIQIKNPVRRSGKSCFPPELRQRLIDDLQLPGLSART